MTTILDIRPGLAGMIARAREALSDDARRVLDEHVTQAEALVSDVFDGCPFWRLKGSDALWVTLPDLAAVMDVTDRAVRLQVEEAAARGEIDAEDIRRGVRNESLDADGSNPSGCGPSHKDPLCLTTSPTGVTMVTLRAARLLVMSCRGERGVRFRSGLDRLIDTASATERLLAAMLLDRAGPTTDLRALREARMAANALRQAGDKAGAVSLLRRVTGLPELPAEAPKAGPDNALEQALAILRALPAVIVDGRFRCVHMREARAALTEAGLDPTQTLQALRRRGRLRANHGLGFRTDRKGLGKLDLCMVSA